MYMHSNGTNTYIIILFCYKPKCVQGSEKSVVKFDETGSVPGGISVWSVADIEEAQQSMKTHKGNPFFIDRRYHQRNF